MYTGHRTLTVCMYYRTNELRNQHVSNLLKDLYVDFKLKELFKVNTVNCHSGSGDPVH